MNHGTPDVTNTSSIAIGFLRRGYSRTGGAEAYLLRLAESLYGQGYRVVLLGTGDWPQEEWPGGEVVALPKKSLRKFAKAALCCKKEKKLDLLFSMERVPGVDIFRAGDGVHAAWIEYKKQSLPHWRRWFPFSKLRYREVLACERALFSSSTHVIVNSSMVAHEIVEYFHFSKSQITIIPNGVPASSLPTPFERDQTRKRLGVADHESVVLFVGSGWERKGLRVAIEAVELLNNSLPERSLKLIVAGKGNEKKYVSKDIIFLGPVHERVSMASLYRAADIFILPTIYDPFSNASLEALAAGLPVITSAMNGCSEILTEGLHGSVIENPNDIEGFATALKNWVKRLQEKECPFSSSQHREIRPSLESLDSHEGQYPQGRQGVNGQKKGAAVKIHQECARRGAEFSVEKNSDATLELIREVLNKNHFRK
ncbi:MAG: glycosyltransferase family 4 protein [Chthoniobacterales bacterium]